MLFILLTCISSAYGGCTSDKAIFTKENLISRSEPFVDEIMVDKGFLIEDECSQRNIKLSRPPFLRKQKQLTKHQAQLTADIARARFHVERVIQRTKNYKILSEKIAWNLLPLIDDILVVIAATVNLSPPILKADKFISSNR